ncbi:hypothetical protein MKW92_036643 [Papaver armeniacum]|nr:hypothetical protein MKW92_036643 [Papaver armeniacum]
MCRWKIGTGCATKCFPVQVSRYSLYHLLLLFNHCGGSKSHVVHGGEVCSFINKNMIFSYSDVMFVQMNKFFKSLRSLGWNVIV